MNLLGNYNIAKIIQNPQLYKTGIDNSDSDSESEEIDASDEAIEVGDVNKRDSELRTPLHLAVLAGDVKLVKQLLKHKANVNLVDNVGSNPLHRAAEKGNFLRLPLKSVV